MFNFLFQLGLAFLRLGDSSTALRHFDQAETELLRNNPKYPVNGKEGDGFEALLHYHRYPKESAFSRVES